MPLAPRSLVANRYRIERQIGAGAMGTVYEATNVKLDKRVALKVLNDSAPAALVERFQREAIAASKVRHPGIVVIYDADVDASGMPWIAMELLEGESLRARMQRAAFGRDEALDLVERALEALAVVHDADIVHRDLKPDNLFLEVLRDGTKQLKILDFGIAKVVVEQLGRATATHTAMGTPHYLAPEQATKAKDAGPPADVYGMAVVLYELLSGELPYRADTFGELVRLMYTEGPRSLASVSPDQPPDLVALVDRCLRLDPKERPVDARAMLGELRALRRNKTAVLSHAEIRSAIEPAMDKTLETPAPIEQPRKKRKKRLEKTKILEDPLEQPPQPVLRAEPTVEPRSKLFELVVVGVVALIALGATVTWIAVRVRAHQDTTSTPVAPIAPEPHDEIAPEPPRDPLAPPLDVHAPPPSAQRTASGLATRVLVRGTGTAHPGPTDRVVVQYTGWRAENGERFDSSRDRGPATFPVGGVIPGFAEGLQLMVEGEQRRMWIPQDLAYRGGAHGPSGMLVFDVELIRIESG